MTRDFHVRQRAGGDWIVEHLGDQLAGFRRRVVAEAFGRALAHRQKVSLIVHAQGVKPKCYSNTQLTYAVCI